MLAHRDDLRDEVEDLRGNELEAWLRALVGDWRTAELSTADAALCAYAEKLTRSPSEMSEADVQGLRAEGFDDEAIHSAIQVVAYFNYINRVADAACTSTSSRRCQPYPQPRDPAEPFLNHAARPRERASILVATRTPSGGP